MAEEGAQRPVEAAAVLREWRTMVDDAATDFGRAATAAGLPRTRVGLRRMWVVNYVPIRLPQHIDDEASFTAVGVSKDGAWEPIEVMRHPGTGISYRPGQLPVISAGVPQYRVKGAFIARL